MQLLTWCSVSGRDYRPTLTDADLERILEQRPTYGEHASYPSLHERRVCACCGRAIFPPRDRDGQLLAPPCECPAWCTTCGEYVPSGRCTCRAAAQAPTSTSAEIPTAVPLVTDSPRDEIG